MIAATAKTTASSISVNPACRGCNGYLEDCPERSRAQDGNEQQTTGGHGQTASRYRINRCQRLRSGYGLTGLELARPAGLTVTYQVLELPTSTTGIPTEPENAVYGGASVLLTTTGWPRK